MDLHYLELQNSTLFTNLLQIPLVTLSPYEEKEGKKEEPKNKITLKSLWNRNLNGNGMEKKIVVEMQITFENALLFPLPQNISLKTPWIEFSLEWVKQGEKEYICKMKLFEPRGIWEQDKYDERNKDLNKIANSIKQPLKG